MAEDRVLVNDEGIEIFHGNGWMGHAWTSVWPWAELTHVRVYATDLPPDGERLLAMDIDHVCGEFETVYQDVDGFTEATAAIALRGGVEVPDLEALQPDEDVEIWRASS